MSILKKILLGGSLFFLLLAAACQVNEEAKSPLDLALAELDSLATAVEGSSPSLGSGDLAVLDDLGNTPIVGLGEATHGTKEFFQMKHRIFKYLVERHGFRAFVFECDYAESIYIDRYICRGEGDLEDIMRHRMHFWTWRTVEVKALLEWMRGYNRIRADEFQIHFIGMDCQFLNLQSGLLREYLNRVSPLFLLDAESLLAEVEQITLSTDTLRSWTQEYVDGLLARLQALRDGMAARRAEWVAFTSYWDYEQALQLVTTMVQTCDFEYRYVKNSSDAKLRDQYMADNAIWARQLLGDGAKVAVWAHNGHVNKNPNFYAADAGSTGYHLKERLGSGYKVIGFSFCQGSFRAVGYDSSTQQYTGVIVHTIEEEPTADSYNDLFHKAQKKEFVLRLDQIPTGGDLHAWMAVGRQILDIGAVFNGKPGVYYGVIKILDFYDVMIHFDRTTASEPL